MRPQSSGAPATIAAAHSRSHEILVKDPGKTVGLEACASSWNFEKVIDALIAISDRADCSWIFAFLALWH